MSFERPTIYIEFFGNSDIITYSPLIDGGSSGGDSWGDLDELFGAE